MALAFINIVIPAKAGISSSKYRILITVIALLLVSTTYSQNLTRKERILQAQEQIKKLKDGVLLVRLETKSSTISALREKGFNEKADERERVLEFRNKQIIRAFKEHFTFTDVYFFFSHYTKALKEKRFDEVVFVNDSLQPDLSIHPGIDKFLVAEFARLERPSMDAHEAFGFAALLMRTDQFVQLIDPFPFYVRTFEPGILSRFPDKAVIRLNKKLERYYEKIYE